VIDESQQSHKLKRFLISIILSLLCACCVTAAERPSAESRPNIIFIFADDWGWGDLSCHGNSWLKTPHLDKFASEGTDFQQFNVLNPVCSPSRAALMTGQNPARLSIHQHFAAPKANAKNDMPDWLDPKAPTLPRLLQQSGYRTAHFGKWHLTNRETHGAPTPEAYGYDEAKVFNGGAEWPSASLHDTASNTVAFIKANVGRPFFINVWLHESHTPHVPTTASMKQWQHLDEQQQVYAAVITDGDNAVGEILAALKKSGLETNTIVLFSSDNGPESTGKEKSLATDSDAGVQGYDTYYSVGSTGGLRGRKRSLFEGGVRVPFIVRWPGHATAGAKNDTTVLTAVDMLPTLCAAAGVAVPKEVRTDGENLLDALNGKSVQRTKPIFWEWRGKNAEPDWWPRLAVREGDWKLAMTYDGSRAELYHLNKDRAESKNVAADYPEVVARLGKLLQDWKATLPAKPDPSCISAGDRAPTKSSSSTNAVTLKITPEQRAKAFARWDTDNDGFLTLDEYKAALKGQENIEARFKRFDRNNDGQLTQAEFVNSTF